LLAERLRELIRARGPITFRDWMEAALYDPECGYYNRSDLKRWGREADYRTSPERSELFAATFARYFAKLYDQLGRPERWTIVEGGGGNGRFAQGVLRALEEQHPRVFEATHYLLDEVSSDALSRAGEILSEFRDCVTFDSLSVFSPSNPWLYFSNELLDAFPVHRLSSEGELYVTLDSDNKFTWSTGPLSTPRLAQFLEKHSIKLARGQLIEINLAIDDWLTSVVAKLKRGYVITVDYGAEASELYDQSLRPDGTLRAFSRHGFVDDVLLAPGEYDITSSVNWTQVKATGERLGLNVVEFASQDKFLLSAGLLEELQHKLQQAPTDSEKSKLTVDAREMILPGTMASSFQVLVQERR
jgi:SAM-dependent MidA family methyltransferase